MAALNSVTALKTVMQGLIYHSDHFELGEQFDAQTGYEKSATNLARIVQ